jgi:hypothetical protein
MILAVGELAHFPGQAEEVAEPEPDGQTLLVDVSADAC